jgi:multidrug efflux pump subunit AcrB
LKKRLEQLPDVAMVDISGNYQPEMYILPDAAKLRSLNITQEQLQNAINKNNQIAGSLSIRDGYYQYNVKFASQLMSIEEVENIYLNIEGRLIQLRDIAEVGIRPRDKRGIFVDQGKQALCMAIIKESDARMSDMKENISAMLENFKKEYPDIEFSVTRDQATLLNYTIDNLSQSLVWSIVLAVLVMLFFLKDIRSALIIAFSIPISTIISILFFQLFGLSINTISLAGLIIGVGMMVDNSIIVIDNINQYRERGYSLLESCSQGTLEIIRPLLSSVLTTCAVFIPLIFLGGIAGALFYDQAMAVSIGLFVSLFVSITIVPVIFHLLFTNAKAIKINNLIEKLSLKHLDKYYTIGYHFVFHHRKRAVILMSGFLIAGIISAWFLKLEQMPPIEINEILIKTDWNNSIHIEENQKRVNDIIATFENQCEEISCFVGEKQFFLNREDNQDPNEAEFYIKTKDNASLVYTVQQIRKYIHSKYPDARVEIEKVKNLFEQMFEEETAPLIANLSSTQRRETIPVDTVNRFIEKLATDMPDLQLSPVATVEKIAIHLRPDRLALYNVDQNTVIYELEKNISKNNIGKLNTGSRYIPIVITETAQTLRDILTHTQIVTKDGKNYIPAIDLVELGTEYDYKKITGKKEGVVTSVNIYNTGNDTREIIDNIRKTAQQNNFDVHFEGSLFSGQKTLQEMAIIIIIAILMLYFILAAQFESLSMPLIILVEIPIDLAFTLICLWCCGISLNLMSMIGIIVMCGVIINDSILKIDTIIRLEKEGYPLLEAIHEGGVRRLKPILMTSLTSIIATLPLLWGQDIGSQLQRPLAVTMIAGLGFGTVVSLYFVPLCYYYLSKRLSKKTAA